MNIRMLISNCRGMVLYLFFAVVIIKLWKLAVVMLAFLDYSFLCLICSTHWIFCWVCSWRCQALYYICRKRQMISYFCASSSNLGSHFTCLWVACAFVAWILRSFRARTCSLPNIEFSYHFINKPIFTITHILRAWSASLCSL